ncbi:MAG: TetR/AcrR family transcriptional regulator [Ignavibacteria bacterium]|nr:TetR/AcrR family transcriptional regulator [Ignavibacteria bacterium]
MVNKENKNTTEERILESARQIFQVKGLQGARMQEIADKAGINKAMLHYYYRSKELLFEAVFEEAANRIFPKIVEFLNTDYPLFEKIERFVDYYLTTLLENKYMPAFVLNELNQNPERLVKLMSDRGIFKQEKFIEQINNAIKDELIIHIDPRQLITNIISMSIFPFAGRPILMGLFKLDEESYYQFIESRKKEVPKFIINAIKVK